MTRPIDILYYGGSCVLYPPFNSVRDSIPLIDNGFHIFISFSRFPALATASQPVALTCSSVKLLSTPTARLCSKTRRDIDKVHRHTCGHATFFDIWTFGHSFSPTTIGVTLHSTTLPMLSNKVNIVLHGRRLRRREKSPSGSRTGP